MPKYSKKVQSPVTSIPFPNRDKTATDFKCLKKRYLMSVVLATDEHIPFLIETDASKHSISAVLSNSGHPVAFFSRILSPRKCKHSLVEKESYTIVEPL